MSTEGKSSLQKRGFLRRYITGGKDLGRLRDPLHPSPQGMFHVCPCCMSRCSRLLCTWLVAPLEVTSNYLIGLILEAKGRI